MKGQNAVLTADDADGADEEIKRAFSLVVPLSALLALCAFSTARLEAAPGPIPPPPAAASRTNLPPGTKAGSAPVPAPVSPKAASRTNANTAPVAAKAGAKTNAPAGVATDTKTIIVQTIRDWSAKPAFYPVLGVLVLCIIGAFVLKFLKSKKPAKTATSAEAPYKAVSKLPRSATRKVAVHSCNVLSVKTDARHLWQFDARGARFALNREQTVPAGESLPSATVAKGWSSLWQHKLNIAWLPPEQVFLRVADAPQSDFDETLSMVELQMERLSPIPVAQVVWSVQVLPHAEPNMQTLVVTIAARNAVEEFLGQLEGQGYLADRLEVPMLDQLQATQVTADGAWIYPAGTGGHDTALVAWWSRGTLQNLDLVTLPPVNRPASLKEQLLQMAWSGEMAGWLTSPPLWHLIADAPTAQEWEPALRAGLEQPISVQEPVPAPELAALTARRAAQAEPRANLLPAEFAVRYHQQFVDRLWMRGLGAVMALYLAGLVVYAIALGVATFRTEAVEQQVADIASDYTNAVQLKAKLEVLKDRSDLKFAALDCYRAVAEKLPEGVTLESMNFSDGRKLTLSGTAPSDQVNGLLDFEKQLRKATDPRDPKAELFNQKNVENITYHVGVPPTTMSWTLSLELKRTEAE